MTKLEEIAHAMYLGVNPHLDPALCTEWKDFTAAESVNWMRAARGCVEAMREPGQIACLHALAAVQPSLFLDNQLRYQDSVWHERIKAILSE